MIAELRDAYNSAFDDETWNRQVVSAEQGYGGLSQRVAPSPFFISARLLREMNDAAQHIFSRLCDNAGDFSGDEIVPDPWQLPDATTAPSLLNVDFALERQHDGRVTARVLELQGFASNYFQPLLLEQLYTPLLPAGLDTQRGFYCGQTRSQYLRLLKRTILGDCNPNEVVLVDIEPEKQPNNIEFQLTAKACGISIVCVSQLERRGKQLGYLRSPSAGAEDWVPINRIYSRLVPEEVAARGIHLPWHGDDAPGVSWVVNPRWFFLWSKAVLPQIDHPAVPKTRRLDTCRIGKHDIQLGYDRPQVLKPLFSYGGRGVNLTPRLADLQAIPARQRHEWILMDRVQPQPFRVTPGSTETETVEIRLLFIRCAEQFRPVTTLVRVGNVTDSQGRPGHGARTSLAFVVPDRELPEGGTC